MLYKVGASHRRARYEPYQEVRQILSGAAEPFDTVVRSAPDAYKRPRQHGPLRHADPAKVGHMTTGQQVTTGVSVAANLPAVIERVARRTAAP